MTTPTRDLATTRELVPPSAPPMPWFRRSLLGLVVWFAAASGLAFGSLYALGSLGSS